jgi:hypothetical protein
VHPGEGVGYLNVRQYLKAYTSFRAFLMKLFPVEAALESVKEVLAS